MSASVADAVTRALPSPRASFDITGLQGELDEVAEQALLAHAVGVPLLEAVRDPQFEALMRFHQDLRDSLFVEIPRELEGWVETVRGRGGLESLGRTLTSLARRPDGDGPTNAALQRALAELLVFEAVRLRLLLASWDAGDFERLGGDEADIDAIAWEEVQAILDEPEALDPSVRPLHLMYASASVALARDASERASELRMTSSDVHEQLTMRARLKAALRELRLPESVLLENALSNLLGEDRVELRDLQESRPLALEGLSRQAMDQRVSRGRRALSRPPASWPKRRRPALFDLLRDSAG